LFRVSNDGFEYFQDHELVFGLIALVLVFDAPVFEIFKSSGVSRIRLSLLWPFFRKFRASRKIFVIGFQALLQYLKDLNFFTLVLEPSERFSEVSEVFFLSFVEGLSLLCQILCRFRGF
jgi:hypothetical protein